MATYQTISESLHVHAITINGSRFIADIFPVSSAEQALTQLQAIRKISPDASHHCWAYRLHSETQTRSSDDGEPGGSAGRPILAQIEGHDLFDVVVIITRYFGGTKLGIGGLIRAYGGTAGKALDRVLRRDVQETEALDIVFVYELTKAVEAVLREHQLTATKTDFDATVRMRLDVPVENLGEFRDALIHQTSGRIHFPKGQTSQ
jgi:uncharacterized YigZ family protein